MLALVLAVGFSGSSIAAEDRRDPDKAAHPSDARGVKPSAARRPVAAPGNKRLLLSARERRAVLAGIAREVGLSPLKRTDFTRAAAARYPSLAAEIERAADIGALLATSHGVAGPGIGRFGASAGREFNRSVPILAPEIVTRANSQIFNTWNYLTTRPIPGDPSGHYGWAFARNELSNTYNDAALREFGANWGNAAVGQTAALNVVTPTGQLGWRGRGVTVAVIDSGIDARFANPLNHLDGFAYVHPEFAGRLDVRSRRMLPNGTFDLNIADDAGSHGTHVAGTIGAAFDGVGMVGIAPGANILALKGVGGGGDAIWSMAFAASQSDVRIINGSYGPSAQPGETTWVTGNLTNEWIAVRQALANGKVLVFATGNDFETAPVQAQNPTGIPLFPFIRPINSLHGAYNDGGQSLDFSVMDRLPGFIVAVANLDHNLRIASSSNRCGVAAAWCISAPGGGSGTGTPEGILSTVAQGSSSSGGTPTVGPNGGYAYVHGTSMAAPHVSGVIAVLMEAYPTYSARDIVRLVFATAEDLGDRGVDRIYGHGLVRLDRALAAGPLVYNSSAPFVRSISAGQHEFMTAPISSDRELVVQGTRSGARGENDGDLVIAGVSEFRGGARVATGDLVVDGTLKAPTITIERDARLLGDGLVQGNVIVNGAFKAGTGPGEIQINGSLTMAPGAEFQADIDGRSDAGGPGSYSHVFLFGAGNIFRAGGTFAPSFRGQDEGADNTFAPKIGDRFRLVTTAEGARVEGRFASIDPELDEHGRSGLASNMRLALLYHPTAITLAVTPSSFADLRSHGIALNARQSGVGAALDKMQDPVSGSVTGPAAELFERLAGVDPGALPQTLERLSGAGHAPVMRSAVAAGQLFAGTIGQRLAFVRSGGRNAAGVPPALAFSSDGGINISGRDLPLAFAPTPQASQGRSAGAATYSLWGKLSGHWSRQNSDGAAPAVRTSGGGVTIGADMLAAQGLTLGVAGAYSRSNLSAEGLNGTSTSYLGAVYGSYTKGGFEADLVAGLSHSEFRTTRTFD
ncbi:MAG: S8 family serine peptidase, partial [Beijerinckiaceae bacterium]